MGSRSARPSLRSGITSRWVPIGQPYREGGRTFCLCRCSCGMEAILRVTAEGEPRNRCCIRCSHTKHGHSPRGRMSGAYRSWKHMMERCNNPNSAEYHNYGGRGVSIYDPWLQFPNFLHDMGERPMGDFTIERRDVNGDYCPDNCLWIPRADQAKNRTSNVFLTARGETFHLMEWVRITGIGKATIAARLRRGWTEEKALFTPVDKRFSNGS